MFIIYNHYFCVLQGEIKDNIYNVAFVTNAPAVHPLTSDLLNAAVRYAENGSPALYSTFHPAAIPLSTR